MFSLLLNTKAVEGLLGVVYIRENECKDEQHPIPASWGSSDGAVDRRMPRVSEGYTDKVLRDQGTALNLEKSRMTPVEGGFGTIMKTEKQVDRYTRCRKTL